MTTNGSASLLPFPKSITCQSLVLKTHDFPLKKRRRLQGWWDAEEVGKQLWDKDTIGIQEHVCCLFLDHAKAPVAWAEIARGGLDSCVIDIRLVLSHALLCGACNLVLFHNHPSGFLHPSRGDREITRSLAAACKVLSMELVDHIILGPNGGSYSMAYNKEI